ncbi:DUF2252 domain-containing protein [Rummeliibacillus pycnus]|uniref:DUF2252 domain-containing protein n=1 Tax=Rummeliibacillus pycnus TaxID=101070 RepID=UPI003D2CA4A5
MELLVDRVQNTRRALREFMLETIFNEFDVECMGLSDDKRKIKYNEMMESPFRFFRGSAYLFYYDVTKIPFPYDTPIDKPAWIQGDLHMDNFGCFQNEAGEIVYDVNDFDEGYVGSYLYDVFRMAVSIALYTDAEGLSKDEQKARIAKYLHSYYKQLQRFKRNADDPLTLTFTKDNTKGPVKKVLKKLEKRQRNHLLADITYINEEGKRTFNWDEEIQPVTDEELLKIEDIMKQYFQSLDVENKYDPSHYQVKDVARKYGTGTASIGLSRFYILIEGGQEAGGADDLVLEMKEVRSSIPAYFLPYSPEFWEKHAHQGERVVATQKAMHDLEDPYLGYVTIDDKYFYIRERSPYKKKVKADKLVTLKDYDQTLKTMGQVTAKIHARADMDIESVLLKHHSEVEIIKAIGDVDQFVRHITFAAVNYKKQVKYDYTLFCEWVQKKF